MQPRSIIGLAGVSSIACLGTLAMAAPAGATAETGSAVPFSMDLGPVGAAPANCPFGASDDASFTMVSGTMVMHDSQNKNGDWGGETVEGIAQFTVGAVTYTGHLTLWGGGGNNAVGQMEGGDTFSFHGAGTAGTLDVHANEHQTVNAKGNPTANHMNGSVACS